MSWAAAYSDAADVVASAPDMATVQQQVQRAQQLLRANLSQGLWKKKWTPGSTRTLNAFFLPSDEHTGVTQ